MERAQTSFSKLLPVAILAALTLTAAIVIGLVFANRPAPRVAALRPTAEAQQYATKGLHLSDVTMQATENFMKQQVVEIQGKIENTGKRSLKAVTIYCIFSGIDGKEIHREALPIVVSKGQPMKPHDIRSFRLPFDNSPEGWNQAMPAMVISSIVFADD